VRIAILGAGNVGSALARAFVRLGHSVVLCAKHPDHAMKVAADVGAEAAGSDVEAVRSAELVVLAVPSTAVASILEEAAKDMVGKVVVDSTNPMNVDYMEMLSAEGRSRRASCCSRPSSPWSRRSTRSSRAGSTIR